MSASASPAPAEQASLSPDFKPTGIPRPSRQSNAVTPYKTTGRLRLKKPPAPSPDKQPVGEEESEASGSNVSEDGTSSSNGSSSESGSSADQEAQNQADFMGGVKTCLSWSCQGKQPGVLVRQVLETNRRLQLKFRGHLSTSTGDTVWRGDLRKNMFSTSLPRSCLHRVYLANSQRRRGILLDEPHLDPHAWLPVGLKAALLRDWVLSPGVVYGSGTAGSTGGSTNGRTCVTDVCGVSAPDGLRYSLGIRKAPQVVKLMGRTDMWFSGKGECQFDPANQTVTTTAGVRLKVFKYNVTSKQDFRVTLGLDMIQEKGAIQQSPYFKVAENNWAVRLKHGQCTCTYEL